MFGLLKMHLLKMFKQKSFYIISILYILTALGYKKTIIAFMGLPTVDFATLSSSMSSFYPMFAALFAVFLFSKDITSGFIKNYGGALTNRYDIAIERIIFSAIESAILFIIGSIGTLCLVSFDITLDKDLFIFLALMYLTGFAMTLFCLAFLELTRNNTITIVFTILVGLGLVNTILSSLIGMVFKNFELGKYTLSGVIGIFAPGCESEIITRVVIIALAYIAVSTAASIASTAKRDVLIS